MLHPPVTTSLDEVQSFPGMVNYLQSCYIPDFAASAAAKYGNSFISYFDKRRETMITHDFGTDSVAIIAIPSGSDFSPPRIVLYSEVHESNCNPIASS